MVVKAVEQAYLAVRSGIVRGKYPEGTRLTENEIAEAAGVSRTPVREALRRLGNEGLLTFVPHHGAIVTRLSPEEADDLFELRALIESYGADRAASRASEADRAELRRLAEAQFREASRRKPGHLERIGELNRHFHQRLQEAAGSDRLQALVAQLIEAPLVARTFNKYSREQLLSSARHHLEIVRALEARDGQWAAAVMRAHILSARQALRTSDPAGPKRG